MLEESLTEQNGHHRHGSHEKLRFPDTFMRQATKGAPTAAALLNLFGGLSGVISILAIIFYGGQMAARLESHEGRLSKIEDRGSAGLVQHEMVDDQRVADIKVRIQKLEEAVGGINGNLSEIRADLRGIRTYLEKTK